MVNKLTSSVEPNVSELRQSALLRQVRALLLPILVVGAAAANISCASTPINTDGQLCTTRTKCPLPPDFPNVKMEYLKFLVPAKENYAKESSMPQGLSENQRPPLWPCDKPEKDKKLSSSLALEAAKQAKDLLVGINARHKERRHNLELLNEILNQMKTSMNTRGNSMKKTDKGIAGIQKLQSENSKATLKIAPLWENFQGRVEEIQIHVDQLIQWENEAGNKSGQCAKSQPELTPEILTQKIPSTTLTNVGEFEDYKPLMPNDITLQPFYCAEAQGEGSDQINTELTRWLDLLEKILAEHMSAALKREMAYVYIKDKENGVDPNEKMREINQATLAQSRCVMSKVHKLKEDIQKVIQKETEMAKNIKRCERVE